MGYVGMCGEDLFGQFTRPSSGLCRARQAHCGGGSIILVSRKIHAVRPLAAQVHQAFTHLVIVLFRRLPGARHTVISVRQPSNGRLSTKYVLLFRFKNTCATRRPSGPSTCPIFVRLERRVNFRRRCDLTASARCLQPRCAPFHLPKLCVLQPAQSPHLPGRSHRVIRLEHLPTPCYLFDL